MAPGVTCSVTGTSLRALIAPRRFAGRAPWRAALVITLVATCTPLTFVVCSAPDDGWRAPAGTRPHIVVILIDTLRLDHTTLAGYHRNTTPGLARLADRGLTFEHHFSNAPWTKASVATLLTGLLPSAHGSQWGERSVEFEYRSDVLAEGFETLPEALRRHGYSTRAFMTNTSLSKSLGYAQGFDKFIALPPTLAGDRRAVKLTGRALDRATGPTFVWCHLMAVHNYVLPGGKPLFRSSTQTDIDPDAHFAPRLIESHLIEHHEDAVDRYDTTIEFADRLLTILVARIRARHPNTLVIVTSDHGEEFLEHGGYLHARTLYNEMLRVPLVMSGPGLPSGASVNRLTDHADLFATILDYLRLPEADTQGESLFRATHDGPGRVYAEKRNGVFAARSLITQNGKFIESKPAVKRGIKPSMAGDGSWEYYRDPLGGDSPDSIAAAPSAALDTARAAMAAIWFDSQERHQAGSLGRSTQREMTPQEIEALRALGYAE